MRMCARLKMRVAVDDLAINPQVSTTSHVQVTNPDEVICMTLPE